MPCVWGYYPAGGSVQDKTSSHHTRTVQLYTRFACTGQLHKPARNLFSLKILQEYWELMNSSCIMAIAMQHTLSIRIQVISYNIAHTKIAAYLYGIPLFLFLHSICATHLYFVYLYLFIGLHGYFTLLSEWLVFRQSAPISFCQVDLQ